MSTILLSFDSETFASLERGEKKFEYRKHFPKDDTKVFFYVSTPVKAISGIAFLGKREPLVNWVERYSDRSSEVRARIQDYLTDCNYVMPIHTFQKTSRIPLEQLRIDIPNFIVPRMYYYIDNSDLLQYLERELIVLDKPIKHSFETILDCDIC